MKPFYFLEIAASKVYYLQKLSYHVQLLNKQVANPKMKLFKATVIFIVTVLSAGIFQFSICVKIYM